MPKIFVSYRRIDSADRAHRIADWLIVNGYGKKNVFIDVDTIKIGEQFEEVIQTGIQNADVVLVVIGDMWVSEFARRYDPNNPESDIVLLEISQALQFQKLIIPVLLDPNIQINPQQLPFQIRPITSLNYAYARLSDFHHDMKKIRARIQGIFGYQSIVASRKFLFGFIAISTILLILMLMLFNVLLGSESLPPLESSPSSLTSDSKSPTQVPTKVKILSTETTSVETTGLSSLNLTQTVASIYSYQTARAVTQMTKVPSLTPVSTATATPSLTPTLIPTESPTTVILSPYERAKTRVTLNDDWTPHEQVFDGVPMVLVPTGCFMMGSTEGDVDEQPVHQQCIDEPFWIDKFEVTNAQYGISPSTLCNNYSSSPQQPRNCVRWVDAQDYCIARGGSLPSELHWEYAARGVSSLKFPWGDDPAIDRAVFDFTSSNQTNNVGTYSNGKSWVGALDMAGNVWEMTSTTYGYDDNVNNYLDGSNQVRFSYPYVVDNRENREQPNAGLRVMRGGAFWSISDELRTANRDYIYPFHEGSYVIGFRCYRPYSVSDAISSGDSSDQTSILFLTITDVSGGINVRQGPGINYGIVSTAWAGEIYETTGYAGADNDIWFRIILESGDEAWIFGQFVEYSGVVTELEQVVSLEVGASNPSVQIGATYYTQKNAPFWVGDNVSSISGGLAQAETLPNNIPVTLIAQPTYDSMGVLVYKIRLSDGRVGWTWSCCVRP